MIALVTNVSLHFNTPELGYVAAPLVLLLLGLAALRFWRSGTRPRTRARRLVVLVGLTALFAAGTASAMEAGPATRRGLLLALVAILLLWSVPLGYARTTASVSGTARAALVALRILAMLAVLLLLARPTIQRTIMREQRPTLAVLLDDSQSMRLRDMPDGGTAGGLVSRVEAVRDALDDNWEHFERLAEAFDIVGFTFGEDLTRAGVLDDEPWALQAGRPLTDIGAALDSVAGELSSATSPLGAVLFLSDGSNNVGSDRDVTAAARTLVGLNVPIFAAGVGSPEPRGDTRSLVGLDLRAPDRVAVDAILPIEADFEAVGMAGTTILIECLWDGTVFEKTTIRPSDARQKIHVSFSRRGRPAGFHALEVRATPRDRQWTRGPVSLSQFVRVEDHRIHILLVESRPRSETGFIVRALATEPRFHLTKALLGRPLEGVWSNPLPRNADGWRQYHVVLFGDVRRRDLTRGQIQSLADIVSQHGTGLAMIGGFGAGDGGGFRGTPLEDVLPIELTDGGAIDAATRLGLTPAGESHVLCKISDEANAATAWARLPAASGVWLFGRPKPTAEVLVTDQDDRAVVVASTIGAGRSLAIGVDTTWRWPMRLDDGADLHRRFWRQAVYWLANRRPLVQIAVEQPRYDLLRVRPGTRGVTIEAFVVNGLSGLPLEGATLDVTLTAPGGAKTRVDMLAASDRWTQRTFPEKTGAYALTLVATVAGEEVGRAETRFVVETIDRERRSPLANLDLLEALCADPNSTDTRYADIADLSKLLDALHAGDFNRQIRETVRQDLGSELRWPMLIVVCVLLSIEWIVRKRLGLV